MKKDIPKIIEDVGFDFHWDSRKVWKLDVPVEEMNIEELIWHFEIPFWEMKDTDDYNLTPNEVIKEPNTHSIHYEKVQNADLKYPIDIMENKGRWLILDGLHRLVKVYLQGLKTVQVRKIPRSRIPEILKNETKKVVLFDVYQTLIDIDINEENKKVNQVKAWEHLAKSLEEYGVKVESTKLIELNKKQQEAFYIGKDNKIQHHNFCKILGKILRESFGVELPEEKVCSLIYEYHKIARRYARLYPDVAETLAQLKEKYILSVASYTQGCFTKFELLELGIDKYFSYFVYTSDIGFHKASPKFYEQCLEITGTKAESCAMVGDNYDVDILIPKKLGLKTVWVKNPLTAHQYIHLFEQEPKDMINLAEFAKLPEVIERIFN